MREGSKERQREADYYEKRKNIGECAYALCFAKDKN